MGIIDLFRNKPVSADRFERLMRPNIDTMYRFAFRLCGSRDDAEELVQLFLTRLYPKIDQLEKIERLPSWLCRGLYNLYIDGYRRKGRENGLFFHDGSIDDSTDDEDTTFIEAADHELSRILLTAVNRLNNDQRIVVLLHHSEGYTLEELSEILQVPSGTLKSRLSRAHRKLKKSLSMEPFDHLDRVEGIER